MRAPELPELELPESAVMYASPHSRQGVDPQVRRGGVFHFLAPNGTGKSTSSQAW